MSTPENDALKCQLSHTLHHILTKCPHHLPLSSMDLLVRLVADSAGNDKCIRFRLTDKRILEGFLREFATCWEYGVLLLDEDMTVLGVRPVPAATATTSIGTTTDATLGKRKRPDDDEETAAEGAKGQEGQVEENAGRVKVACGALTGLSKELREAYALLQRGTARGKLLAEEHQSVDTAFEPICEYITKDECSKNRSTGICDRVHFRALIRPHTDPSLGHCSYLNTCYSEPTYFMNSVSAPAFGATQGHYNPNHPSNFVSGYNQPGLPPSLVAGAAGGGHGSVRTHPSGLNVARTLPSGLGAGGRGKEKAPCRYLHFEIDWDEGDGAKEEGWASKKLKDKEKKLAKKHTLGLGLGPDGFNKKTYPPQWINCDLRRFDYSVLGKFHVIMADPPWDIHMSLPYGTMTDDEMRAMPIPMLQDEGLLFLWVTGRAMEVGRECMRVWGYTRVDEVIWVKTNQLQRVIRTGRTGHWLNHTKEHMLVGIKTVVDPNSSTPNTLKFPSWANRGLDTDVIVSEVRETSRKPDEVYGMIERMCPGGRKVEIFGRKHNTRPGWLTLGNQLGADQIYEEDLAARIKARYPDRNVGPANGTAVPFSEA